MLNDSFQSSGRVFRWELGWGGKSRALFSTINHCVQIEDFSSSDSIRLVEINVDLELIFVSPIANL